jgi:hypothetical protein
MRLETGLGTGSLLRLISADLLDDEDLRKIAV